MSGYLDAFCASADDFLCIADNIFHSLDVVFPAVRPAGCALRNTDAVVVSASGPIPFPRRDLYALVCVSNHNTLPGARRASDSTMQYCCSDDWLRSMRITVAGEHRLSTRHKTQRFPKNIVCFVQFLQLMCQPRDGLFRCFSGLYATNLTSGEPLCPTPVVYGLRGDAKPPARRAHSDFIGQFQHIGFIFFRVFPSHLLHPFLASLYHLGCTVLLYHSKKLRAQSSSLQIVFVTGYTDYVFDGYTVGALGYVLKPPQQAQIDDVLTRAMAALFRQAEQVFVCQNRDGMYRIPKSTIRYFCSDRRQVTCVTDTRRVAFYARLDEVEQQAGRRSLCAHPSAVSGARRSGRPGGEWHSRHRGRTVAGQPRASVCCFGSAGACHAGLKEAFG